MAEEINKSNKGNKNALVFISTRVDDEKPLLLLIHEKRVEYIIYNELLKTFAANYDCGYYLNWDKNAIAMLKHRVFCTMDEITKAIAYLLEEDYFDKEDPSVNARRKMSTADEIKYINAKRQSATGAPKKSQAESNTISKDWRKWDGTGDVPVQPSHAASDKEWDEYTNSPQSRRYDNAYDRENMNTKGLSVFARRNLKEADFLNTDKQRGRFAKERELRKKQMEDEEIKRNKDVPSNTIRDTFRTPSSSKFNKVTVKKKDSGPVNAKDVAKYIRRPGLF